MNNLILKLSKIQKELKAPKGQRNSFGNYNYRSCEDILEAVKPLLENCILTISDEVVVLGDRYYVKATAKLQSEEQVIENTAYARESLEKKGMDSSQITGATSSYARKYALNGLFAIDDTKDMDTDEISIKTLDKVAPMPSYKLDPTNPLNKTKCELCGKEVPLKVRSFSLSKYNQVLCFNDQQTANSAKESVEEAERTSSDS
jgi:hypothetical protein